MTDDTDEDTAPGPAPRKPRSGSLIVSVIAIVAAIIALAVAGWSFSRLHRLERANATAQQHDAAAVAALTHQLAEGNEQVQAGNQRASKLESALDDLRQTTQGLDRRLANLETAYATLSGQQQSSHDTLLLNDAEMLLRTGEQRYTLFHDSAGALKAYSQAISALAQVQNPAYASVRASAITERDALAAAAPPSRQTALDTLSRLRSEAASLPLASAEAASASAPAQNPGFWARVGHAFGSIVKVSRDNGPAAPAAAPFARQTLALDLAQAQESLLAFDTSAYRAALEQADGLLAGQFDGASADVKRARTQIASLLAQHRTGPAPKLGGALAQLQSLRAARTGLGPAPATTAGAAAAPASTAGATPAHASTTGAGQP